MSASCAGGGGSSGCSLPLSKRPAGPCERIAQKAIAGNCDQPKSVSPAPGPPPQPAQATAKGALLGCDSPPTRLAGTASASEDMTHSGASGGVEHQTWAATASVGEAAPEEWGGWQRGPAQVDLLGEGPTGLQLPHALEPRAALALAGAAAAGELARVTDAAAATTGAERGAAVLAGVADLGAAADGISSRLAAERAALAAGPPSSESAGADASQHKVTWQAGWEKALWASQMAAARAEAAESEAAAAREAACAAAAQASAIALGRAAAAEEAAAEQAGHRASASSRRQRSSCNGTVSSAAPGSGGQSMPQRVEADVAQAALQTTGSAAPPSSTGGAPASAALLQELIAPGCEAPALPVAVGKYDAAGTLSSSRRITSCGASGAAPAGCRPGGFDADYDGSWDGPALLGSSPSGCGLSSSLDRDGTVMPQAAGAGPRAAVGVSLAPAGRSARTGEPIHSAPPDSSCCINIALRARRRPSRGAAMGTAE
jgi:hypothetical protein